VLIPEGITEFADGLFCLAPSLAMAVGRAVEAGDRDRAAVCQRKFNDLTRVVSEYPHHWPPIDAILRARGIPGVYVMAPERPLGAEERRRLLAEPVIQEILKPAEHGHPNIRADRPGEVRRPSDETAPEPNGPLSTGEIDGKAF
jgi:hypothetical protein